MRRAKPWPSQREQQNPLRFPNFVPSFSGLQSKPKVWIHNQARGTQVPWGIRSSRASLEIQHQLQIDPAWRACSSNLGCLPPVDIPNLPLSPSEPKRTFLATARGCGAHPSPWVELYLNPTRTCPFPGQRSELFSLIHPKSTVTMAVTMLGPGQSGLSH